MTYEVLEPQRRHYCKLPNVKAFEKGTKIRCNEEYDHGDLDGFPSGRKIRCGRIWIAKETWFWRDLYWAHDSIDYGW